MRALCANTPTHQTLNVHVGVVCERSVVNERRRGCVTGVSVTEVRFRHSTWTHRSQSSGARENLGARVQRAEQQPPHPCYGHRGAGDTLETVAGSRLPVGAARNLKLAQLSRSLRLRPSWISTLHARRAKRERGFKTVQLSPECTSPLRPSASTNAADSQVRSHSVSLTPRVPRIATTTILSTPERESELSKKQASCRQFYKKNLAGLDWHPAPAVSVGRTSSLGPRRGNVLV
jgi:hypothetical protein